MGRKKKNKDEGYFGSKEEMAVKKFLSSSCKNEKNEIFSTIIDPALRKLISGILTMPKFQKIIGLYKDFDCEEGAYYHLIFNMHKFDPTRIGKDGKEVKAYSYYGTAVKNYVLGLKIQADKKIAEHGGEVDVDDVDYVEKNRQKGEGEEKELEELRTQLMILLEEFSFNSKFTQNDEVVLSCLKYMLENWHKLAFHDKNQFNRLLISYAQLPPNVVMNSFKKIKILVLKNLKRLDK